MKKIFKFTQKFLIISLSLLMIGADIQDPTRPTDFAPQYESTPSSSKQLNLTAIFIIPNFKQTIINGETVKEGSKISGFTISKITLFTVELLSLQNTKEVLSLVVSVKEPIKTHVKPNNK